MSPSQQLTIEQAISRAKKVANQGTLLSSGNSTVRSCSTNSTTRLQPRAYVSCKNSCPATNLYPQPDGQPVAGPDCSPTGVESRQTASLPKLSDMNLVALEHESGSQLQDVVGLTANLDCVSSDKCIYQTLLD